MNSFISKIIIIAFTLHILAISCTDVNNNNQQEIEEYPLILISIDGFRWDYFEKTSTPNLDKIIQKGIKADGLETVYPSKTFPNHVTIVTGRYPDNHGIIGNYFYDKGFQEYFYIGVNSEPAREGKWLQSEPIWVTAEKNAKKAMIMFWPMSEAEFMGIRPTEYYSYSNDYSYEQRVQQILNWLDYEEEEKPSFLATYFNRVDGAGHYFGPESQEVIDEIKDVDSAIGMLIDGLESRKIFDKVNLMIVSDHGMIETPQEKAIDVSSFVDLSDVITVSRGEYLMLRPSEDKISSLYEELKQVPNTRVFTKQEMYDEFKYGLNDRIEPLILVPDEQWTVWTDDSRKPIAGTHGYDPKLRSMDGIFIALGPNFKEGYLGSRVSNIHLYALMCHLLNIEPAQNDGYIYRVSEFLNRD
jgi:ectonucleotide pyrophosphatase/phosphodiesterase family protein 5